MATTSNLEKRGAVGVGKPLTTRRFFSGLFTLRSPLNEPGDGSSTRYYEAISGNKSDALIDGLNVEISNKNTLITRPGFSLLTTIPGGYTPIKMYTAIMPGGNVYLYDTTTAVLADFSGIHTLFTKSVSGPHSRFFTVGSNTFIGTNSTVPKVWDGNTAHAADNLGIATPTVTPSLTLNSGSTIKATQGWTYVYCFASSKYGHVSTASSVSASTGIGQWASITVSGQGSSDPQVDTIQIYRTTDGGAIYEFLGSVANPGASTFTFTDNFKDSALNPFILAPQNGINNPPPSNFAGNSGFAYHAGRIWGASNNILYFSAGPDCTNGNGLMAFPPLNYFQFPDNVQRIVPYSNGLLVFTLTNLYAILGTSSSTFYPKLQQAGMGITSYYCVDTNGTEIYVYTYKGQFLLISPSAGIIDCGFAIGDKLGNNFGAFVSYYANGEDDAVYISNGTNSIYRLNPHQYPEGNFCWSPVSQPTGGLVSMVATCTNFNVPVLAITTSSGTVLMRDTTVATDNGSSFATSFTVGPIGLAMPGEIAEIESISLESTATGNRPTVSVLNNEISGTFTALPNYVADPNELPAFASFHSDKYYLAQAISGLSRQMQIKVAYTADGLQHEVLGYSIFGQIRKK